MEEDVQTSGNRQTGEDFDRRRWPRAGGSSAAAIGRARLLPHLSNHYPSLRPAGWCTVIGQNPEALEARAHQGHAFIAVDGRSRQVSAGHFTLLHGTV